MHLPDDHRPPDAKRSVAQIATDENRGLWKKNSSANLLTTGLTRMAAHQTTGHLPRPCRLPKPGPQVVSGTCGDPGPGPQLSTPLPRQPSLPTASPCPSWRRSGPPSSRGCSPPRGAPRCSPAGTDKVGAGLLRSRLWRWAKRLPRRPGLLPGEDGLSLSCPAPPPSLPFCWNSPAPTFLPGRRSTEWPQAVTLTRPIHPLQESAPPPRGGPCGPS